MGLWIRCGNENAVFTIRWEKIVETEKGAEGQANVKVMLTVFLTSRMLCIMNSYVRANSESLVLSRKC
jgi:hypothetical protein